MNMAPVTLLNPAPEISKTREHLAHGLIKLSNLASDSRQWLAPVIGACVAFTGSEPNSDECDFVDKSLHDLLWGDLSPSEKSVTVAAGGLALTDLEGNGVRLAKWLLPGAENPGGGERDHRADKSLLYWLLLGVAIRRHQQEDIASRNIMLSVLAMNFIRDQYMRQQRAQAVEYGISTDAIAINKVKTGILLPAAVTATTAWAERGYGRHVTHATLIGGTAVGSFGAWKFHTIVGDRIANNR